MKEKQRAILLCAQHGLSVTGSTATLKERLSIHLLKQEMAKESTKISSETFMNLTPALLSEATPQHAEVKKEKTEKKEKQEKNKDHPPASEEELPAKKKTRPLTAYQIFMREHRASVVASIGCAKPKEVMVELGAQTM